jgi:hypothetical protein
MSFTIAYAGRHYRVFTALQAVRIARAAYEAGFQPIITEEYPDDPA